MLSPELWLHDYDKCFKSTEADDIAEVYNASHPVALRAEQYWFTFWRLVRKVGINVRLFL
jgi:hypothetical protein